MNIHLSPTTPTNSTTHTYVSFPEPKETEQKSEEIRKNWQANSFFSAPIQNLKAVIKFIGEELVAIKDKISRIANSFFKNHSIQFTTQIIDTLQGKKAVKELLQFIRVDDKPLKTLIPSFGTGFQILHQFNSDLERSEYYLNNQLLLKENERTDETQRADVCQSLGKKFGQDKFRNMTFILNQAFTADLTITVQNLLEEHGNFKGLRNISAVRYYIEEKGDQIKLSIEVDFQLRDEEDLEDAKQYEYICARRNIYISSEELAKDWTSTPKYQVAPNMRVQDEISAPHEDIENAKQELQKASLAHLSTYLKV